MTSRDNSFLWKAANYTITTAFPFGIMGILNVTPDSFYDGGKYTSVDNALQHAHNLIESGADIIDIGAESSRPGARAISRDTEINRLLPVLEAVKNKFPETVISVDTRNGRTAAQALSAGALIINDISACGHDPELIDALIQYKPGYVLMHTPGKPETMQLAPHYNNIIAEIQAFFETLLNRLVKAGLPEENIVLDPGIGFGKTLAHNLEILIHVNEFLIWGRPILIGISMKSMFGHLLGLPIDNRAECVNVASALLWQKGVFWHRVHNVAQVRNALLLANALTQ